MWKKCNECGNLVLIPKKTVAETLKCEKCGAEVLLKKKKRNGMTKRLKGGFIKPPEFLTSFLR
jgi:DNA-directed RNA polymerase subunit M/transcription elongation factor TFIIS